MANSPEATVDPKWAWQPFRPGPDAPWDLPKVGHLYRRAAFGATLAELEAGVQAGPDRTIDQLLQGRPTPDVDAIVATMARAIGQANSGQQLAAWWLYRMVYGGHPLREKLTLFWHNHFATSNLKVNNAGFMLGQYELLRRHAQGHFRTMLEEMARDPAMMVWLDTNRSQRNRPNENYARELMELFSLGIPHPRQAGRRNYTEQDVREAARAFTGWRIRNNRATFTESDHDNGEKTVLGQRGKWRAEDITRICLEQEAAPYFIVRKLFRFLVSETLTPAPALLEPLAVEFRRSDYQIGPLVARMLRSNLFFAPLVYRTKVKSPVDFALGVVRGLEGHIDQGSPNRFGTTALASALESLGQRLFYPPNVAGWEGGKSWLNGQTFLLRQNLALGLTSTTDDNLGRRTDPVRLARQHHRLGDEEVVDLFLRLFLQGDVPPASRARLVDYARQARQQSYPFFWTPDDAADQRIRAVCHLVLCLPEFQLE